MWFIYEAYIYTFKSKLYYSHRNCREDEILETYINGSVAFFSGWSECSGVYN